VSVGPSGFTIAGIVHLGNITPTRILPDGFMGDPHGSIVLKIMSSMTGLWLWGLCIWFFIVSVGSHSRIMTRRRTPDRRILFDMTWFSFVFPNTALVTATHAIARAFDSEAIKLFGTISSGLLIIVWMYVFGCMIRALWQRTLLWPIQTDAPLVEEKEVNNSGKDGEV
jgi:tellurite resistance protein TehA-like permease